MGVREGANKSLALGNPFVQDVGLRIWPQALVVPPSLVRIAATSVALLALLTPQLTSARESTPALGTVKISALPSEAQQTDRLIHAGGPFPYPKKDGTVFGNRERILPKRPRGDYREYTVKTPGSRDRGARRIVCAGKEPTTPEVCYYTGDHYSSFQRIVR